MLNLVWVRSFLALVDRKSFQGAAELLYIAQPTVSLHIQKLEEQLGVPLFHRSRSGCEPTREALNFLPYAQSIIRVNERAIASVRGGPLRLGASSNIGIYLLQPYLRSFLDKQIAREVEVVIDRNPTIAERLENGEIDVALMEWWDGRAGCEAQLWRSEPVVVIVPPGHPLAEQTVVSRSELSEMELLGGEPGTGTGRLLARYFGGAAKMPRVSRQLGSTEAVKQAVKAGLGVSLVFASAVSDEVRSGRLVAIPLASPGLSKDLFIVWGRTQAGAAEGLVEHLLEVPSVKEPQHALV
jgi:Transcriptional regulator